MQICLSDPLSDPSGSVRARERAHPIVCDPGALGRDLPGDLGLRGHRTHPTLVVFAAAGAKGVLAAAVITVLEGVDIEGVIAGVEQTLGQILWVIPDPRDVGDFVLPVGRWMRQI